MINISARKGSPPCLPVIFARLAFWIGAGTNTKAARPKAKQNAILFVQTQTHAHVYTRRRRGGWRQSRAWLRERESADKKRNNERLVCKYGAKAARRVRRVWRDRCFLANGFRSLRATRAHYRRPAQTSRRGFDVFQSRPTFGIGGTDGLRCTTILPLSRLIEEALKERQCQASADCRYSVLRRSGLI